MVFNTKIKYKPSYQNWKNALFYNSVSGGNKSKKASTLCDKISDYFSIDLQFFNPLKTSWLCLEFSIKKPTVFLKFN